jgi:hypothetical protein
MNEAFMARITRRCRRRQLPVIALAVMVSVTPMSAERMPPPGPVVRHRAGDDRAGEGERAGVADRPAAVRVDAAVLHADADELEAGAGPDVRG